MRSYDFSKTLYERKAEVLSTVKTEQSYYDAIHEGMYGVTHDASAGTVYENFIDAPYSVAGKTGTAQTGSVNTNNGVFICYAPYDDPQIAVAVVIEKGVSGSGVAKVARAVLDYYFSFADSAAALEGEGALLK